MRVHLRTLLRKPRFTVIAVLTMALGVGANVAVFSVVKAILLQPFPYSRPDRLVFISETGTGASDNPEIDRTILDALARHARTLTRVAAYSDGVGDLQDGGAPEIVRGLHVTRNFFDTLGVPLLRGRTFTEDEARPGQNRAVILSHEFWMRRFGGDPAVVGRTLRFDYDSVLVVGILPPQFRPFIRGTSELLPEMYTPLSLACQRCQAVRGIARMADGASVETVREELTTLVARLPTTDPAAPALEGVLVTSLPARLLGRATLALWVVFAAVGLVLLAGVANIASMALADALGRRDELSVRAALGASRGALAAQLLTESLALSLVAGAIGVAVAYAGTGLLAAVVPANIPRPGSIAVDLPVLAFALTLTLASGLLMAAAPAAWALRGGFHAGTGTRVTPTRRPLDGLIVVEIAVAFVLVLAAGLMTQSDAALMRVAAGYNPSNVLTLTTRVWTGDYAKPARAQAYYTQMLAAVRAVPGVESAAITSVLPMDSPRTTLFTTASLSEPRLAGLSSVSDDYFRVLQIPLVRGRTFDTHDTPDSTRVAIVSEALARRVFGPRSPIGDRLQLNDGPDRFTIVGVAGNVHQEGLDREAGPQIYVAESQDLANRFYRLVARTSSDPMTLVPNVNAAILAVDPRLPVNHVKPLEAFLEGTVAERQFAAQLLLAFGAIALVLAAVGAYGLTAYAVARRQREFAVRAAMGATAPMLVTAVVRQMLLLAAGGLGAGVAIGLMATTLMRGLLFSVSPSNPVTYAAAGGLLALTVALAASVPALRAARANPAELLSGEPR